MEQIVIYLIIPAIIVLLAWLLFSKLFNRMRYGVVTQLAAIIGLTIFGNILVGYYYGSIVAAQLPGGVCVDCGLVAMFTIPFYLIVSTVATVRFRIKTSSAPKS